MKADSVCICFVTKRHHTALLKFSFSLVYILLFSVRVLNVNVAKNSTVLDNLSVNILYRHTYRDLCAKKHRDKNIRAREIR